MATSESLARPVTARGALTIPGVALSKFISALPFVSPVISSAIAGWGARADGDSAERNCHGGLFKFIAFFLKRFSEINIDANDVLGR